MATLLEDYGLTFDDLLLVPQESAVHPREVDLNVQLTKRIQLHIPVLSAAMDTVTEHRLAIALAQMGGIGIIHKNLSIDEQAREVEKVKRSENGVITDPQTLPNNATVGDCKELMELYHISGIPVVEGDKLKGLVTRRDLKYQRSDTTPISDVMTTDLITAIYGEVTLQEARDLMYKAKVERLVLKDRDDNLKGMITLKDLDLQDEYPNSCKDDSGRLRVGAAVGVNDPERVAALVAAGADIIVIDSAHGHSKNILDTVKAVKAAHDIDVIAGNVATTQGAEALYDAGADVVKVGIGPGSICTTRVIAGVGVPQMSAIMQVNEIAQKRGKTFIADGGIKYSGDIAKALAGGAQVVMLGSILAGTDESPGEQIIYHGRSFKSYRGMGSMAAMQKGSADRYFQDSNDANKLVAEGIEGMVPSKGPLSSVIHQMMGGLRSSMGYCGAPNLQDFSSNSVFVRITAAGLRESHPHDVQITKEAPNYRAE